MVRYADAVRHIFIAGPINRKIIQSLLLQIVIYGIYIHTATAYLAGPQFIEPVNRRSQYKLAASAEIGLSKLDAIHCNIA